MNRTRFALSLIRFAGVAGVCAVTSAARGDQVTAQGETLARGRINGFAAGRVSFRGEDGATTEVPIEAVERIFIDSKRGFDDFNQAEEAFSRGEFARAFVPYERALRAAPEGFWPDLVTCRLLVAFDRGQRLDRAVQQFIRAARGEDSGPAAAARLLPRSIPAKRDEATVNAVQQLDEALRAATDPALSALLRVLRYRILAAVGDPRADAERQAVAALAIPEPARSRDVYGVQREAIAALLASRTQPEDLALLDGPIGDCPSAALPDFLLLKGRTLLARAKTREEIIRATWPLMRVAIHMPDDPRAAEALFESAGAMERLGRPDKALRLLEECAAHKAASEDFRKNARAAIERLKAGKG